MIASCSKTNIHIQVSSMKLLESPSKYESVLSNEDVDIVGMLRFTIYSNIELAQFTKDNDLNVWVRPFWCENHKPMSNLSSVFTSSKNAKEYFVFLNYESEGEHSYGVDNFTDDICFSIGMGNMNPLKNIRSNTARYKATPAQIEQINVYKRSGGETRVKSNLFDISG